MKGFSPISRAYRRLVRKHRLTLQNEVDNAEEWHMHISVVRIFAALLAFVLLLFILILSLVAYTPVLEFLPGYEANRSREMLLQNIMRLDSIERQMTQMRTYSDNIALIMEGKTPVVRNVGSLDSIKADKTLVMPSREDSLLRIQMEGEGPYGLGKSPSRKTLREAMAMTAPVEGIITEKFDTKLGQYGIRIAAAPGSQVSAVDNGTVVITVGGGGIPVVCRDGKLYGTPAVIDKDFASAKLAELLDADMLVILTAVEKVAINFGKPDQKGLDTLTPDEARKYIDEKQFAPGSMLPKVQAAMSFAESKPGRVALITLLEKAAEGIEGKTGTRVQM